MDKLKKDAEPKNDIGASINLAKFASAKIFNELGKEVVVGWAASW